jgi:hypothetical protein
MHRLHSRAGGASLEPARITWIPVSVVAVGGSQLAIFGPIARNLIQRDWCRLR